MKKRKTFTLEQFKKWGRRGGLKRKLTPKQARKMVEARERKRKEKRDAAAPKAK